MARGNQREKAREKNLKAAAGQVGVHARRNRIPHNRLTNGSLSLSRARAEKQKHGMPSSYPRREHPTGEAANHRHQQSGTEFARTKEDQAAIMRAKQAAGTYLTHPGSFYLLEAS